MQPPRTSKRQTNKLGAGSGTELDFGSGQVRVAPLVQVAVLGQLWAAYGRERFWEKPPGFALSIDVLPQGGSKCFDDDGRLKRTGTVWTAGAHIITAVIGSGILSLAWATAQLGWIAGPAVMFLFSFVTYYTSTLLATCYRSGDDPVNGKRNYTYMEAVRSNHGGFKVKICGWVQYLNLFGVAIGLRFWIYITGLSCFHASGGKNLCKMNSNPYMIAFGIVEIIFSQIPDFDQFWWLSIVAAVISFTYSTIGLGLGIAQVAANGNIRGSLTGITVGTVTQTQKIWLSFQALGNIAFAYSYSLILIEIQDTLKAPPAESKTMKKATLSSVAMTTLFYMLRGCMWYAAFGDSSPGNLLTGFGFYNPFWLIDIANAAIVIHLVGAYQVYRQPLFAFIEKSAVQRFPDNEFVTKDIKIPVPGFRPYNLNLFRIWPLTVYFPVEMYISQKKIPKWSKRWICLQILSAACLIITIAAAAGSIAEIMVELKSYKLFSTSY
ncbi:Amino acid permease 5 [Hibiscus syriacus]|uniref:Amino acid permease 5 n=1 Tax=Hibiscus syriacus TaxID=106335 RepID=A0A6A3AII5_HIBSY|nr:Amino acid permease 5 [Hibiscus syriacus]